jgi:hypothetical protein
MRKGPGSVYDKWNLMNAEHLKGSAFNAEVLLGVVNHGLMISCITLTDNI